MWFKFTLLSVTAILCVSFEAIAQDDSDKTYVSLSVENDNLGGGSDRYYTSGVRATWFNTKTHIPKGIDILADKIPTFDLDENTSTFFTLGHNIYTPADIKIASPQPSDRPWAAFLYGSVGLANITQNKDIPFHVDEAEFTFGVIGPEALGKPIQSAVHKYISHSPEPRGWKNQLDFEPGFVFSWQRRMPYALSYDTTYFNARIEPNFNISLGTIRTHAGAGATFIVGSSKELDTPQRVRPAIPGTGVFFADKKKLNWQVFAGTEARLVGRDIFLDGNTFTDSPSVDKKYFVTDISAGASLIYNSYRLSYTINGRSKEFKGQEKESVFGSLTLTKQF